LDGDALLLEEQHPEGGRGSVGLKNGGMRYKRPIHIGQSFATADQEDQDEYFMRKEGMFSGDKANNSNDPSVGETNQQLDDSGVMSQVTAQQASLESHVKGMLFVPPSAR